MTAYFCAATVNCGHNGCSKTAYIECSRYMAEQLSRHRIEWFCSDHKDEQVDDLSFAIVIEEK